VADILADAREWLDTPGRLENIGTHGEECHRWHLACLVSRLADEIVRLRGSLNVVAACLSEMEKGLEKHLLKLPPEPQTKEVGSE